jgi:hypothetical protein
MRSDPHSVEAQNHHFLADPHMIADFQAPREIDVHLRADHHTTPDLGTERPKHRTAKAGWLWKPWLEKNRPRKPPQHFLPKRSASGEFRVLVTREVHGALLSPQPINTLPRRRAMTKTRKISP